MIYILKYDTLLILRSIQIIDKNMYIIFKIYKLFKRRKVNIFTYLHKYLYIWNKQCT